MKYTKCKVLCNVKPPRGELRGVGRCGMMVEGCGQVWFHVDEFGVGDDVWMRGWHSILHLVHLIATSER
jgi:hypothetical protein